MSLDHKNSELTGLYLLSFRSYIEQNYTDVKSENPDLPFIVRECQGAQPCVTARYDFGVERKVYLHNASSAEVGQAVSDLVDQASVVNTSAAAQRF